MNFNFTGRVMLFILFLSFIAALYTAFLRHGVESDNNAVEIAMDYTAFAEMAMSEGKDEKELALSFKNAGLTAFAFTEDTPEKMRSRGKAAWYHGNDLLKFVELPGFVPDGSKMYLITGDYETAQQVRTYLLMFYPAAKAVIFPEKTHISNAIPAVFELPVTEAALPFLSIGFSPKLLAAYSDLGFDIIVRPDNKPRLSSAVIDSYFKEFSSKVKIGSVIFAGADNDVMGFPNYLNVTADALDKYNLNYGIIEAPNVKAMQKGIQTVSQKIPNRAIRVMSLPPLQQQKLTFEAMADKYGLGIGERNMRILYIRPHTILKDDKNIIETNLEYINSINSVIKEKGLRNEPARPFKSFSPSFMLLLLMSLAPPALLTLIFLKIGVDKKWIRALWLAWLIATLLLIVGGKDVLWRKLSSLGVGILAPITVIYLSFESIDKLLGKMTLSDALAKSSLYFSAVFLLCTASGFILSGLLSSESFFLQVDMFRGIKLVLLMPPLVLLILWLSRGSKAWERIRSLMKQAVIFLHLFIIGIFSAAGGYYLIRSGNAGEWAVSDTELSLRRLLSKVLPVRPRFKEFLLGFPAAMLYPALSLFGIERYAWLLVLVSAIGFSDLMDTFAHLHTPLAITAVRVFISGLLGWIMGVFLLIVAYFIKGKMKQTRRGNNA